MYVLNLLIPKESEFTEETLEKMLATLAPNKHKWTQPGRAFEMEFRSQPAAVQLNAAKEMGEFDMIIQPKANRRKKLLVCDMDSTIIEQECIDELADFVGKKDEISAITEKAMNGELDFAQALEERVALLKGLSGAQLQQCFEERITFSPGAKELIGNVQKNGVHTVLVSGGFAFFAARVAKEAGFNSYFANMLEVENGILTGKVQTPILDKDAKLTILKQKVDMLGITMEETAAIGDGANDLPMLQGAGLGIAYRAKPVVQQATKAQINHSDLQALVTVIS